MDKEKIKKVKKSGAAAVASAAIFVNGIFSPPANLPDQITIDKVTPPAVVEYVMPDFDEDFDDVVIPDDEKKKRFTLSSWYSSRKFSTRLILSAAFTVFICSAVFLLYLYLSQFLPVWACYVLKAVLASAAALLGYTAIIKAASPNTPISEIIKPKNILLVIVSSCAIFFTIDLLISLLNVHK